MNKPFTMTVKETEARLAEVCNNSGLPLVVLDLIVRGLSSDIHSLVEKQAVEEEKAYENAIKDNDIKNNINILGGANETE